MGLLSFTPVNTISQGQVQGYNDAYGQSQNAANVAQQNQQQFTQNMQDPSQMYQQNVSGTESQLGFDPSQIAKANQQLAVTQNQIANLPQAIQAQGGGYGVTAGQMANNYTQSAGNLNNVLGAQGNNLNAMQSTYQNAINQAGQQTQFGVQGQQMKLQGLQNITQNALSQMDQARQTMGFYQDLYQKQGQFNASEQAEYQKANAAFIQAQASASLAASQAAQIQQQMRMIDAASSAAQAKAAAASSPAGLSSAWLQAQGATPQSISNYTTPQSNFDIMKHGSLLDGLGAAWKQVTGL